MLARLLGACAFILLSAAELGAAAERCHDIETAETQWHGTKGRQELSHLGVVGGSYKVSSSGEGFIVEAVLYFRGGGKMAYRKYHSRSTGFPGPVALARLYRHVKAR